MANVPTPRIAVLLVEDNPLQLAVAASILREAGYDVAEAATVDAAQAHLAARPELVAMIADVDLAGEQLTGFTLAKAVAARWPEIAILIVSGLVPPTDGDMPMGARFLPKPYMGDALVRALRSTLEARGLVA